MDTPELLQTAQSLLAPWTQKVVAPEPNRLDIYLVSENLVEAVRTIFSSGGWHLSAITGMDVPQSTDEEGEIEILYHFCCDAAIVTLRVLVPYGLPEVPTVCGVIPSANLYERELIEMFGVIVDGTPNREKLLLPDDWPDYVYPLRKSFKGLDKD